MNEFEIREKLKKCDKEYMNTKSPYRKRDLQKYRKRLLKELNSCRRCQ